MKQCPNPNCILYTRLEELPDAYVKCPGCGGQLVDSSTTSGVLRSGYLSKMPGTSLSQIDLDQEFEQAFPGMQSPSTPVYAPAAQNPPQYDDEYYPYEDTEQDESVEVPLPGISRAARIAYALALLLLLAACGLFAFVLTTRILPSRSVTSAEATETAIVAMRPAVNTPVPVMPTVPQSELPPAQPTLTTPPVAPPTQAPQSQPPTPTAEQPQTLPPTQAPSPPTATNPPPSTGDAPTAPPAQSQPTGGITNAQMVTSLVSGAPVDNVTSYGANDPFVLAVQAQFGAGGVTNLRTRWYGPDGRLLYEIPRDFSVAGTYYTGFTLKKNTPWLEGNYRVDIHTNNSASPSYSVSFSVRP